MASNRARPIELTAWPAPQGNLLLVFSLANCSVYFGCWASAGLPADYAGHIQFSGVQAVRSYPREVLPCDLDVCGIQYCLIEIDQSAWLQELREWRRDANRTAYQHAPVQLAEMRHFVVRGHDIYHEILAASFEEFRLARRDITDPRVLELIDAA